MSLEPVAWLCKTARDLPKEVKRQIAYYGQHPLAPLIKELTFTYEPVPYEPLSQFLYVQCPYPHRWVARRVVLWGRQFRRFWICRSIYHPDISELPAWVIEEARSPDQ